MEFIHNILHFINWGFIKSFIIMMILFTIMILIHELGHMLAAKAVGIRVDKFGFGFPIGPTLFSKKIGETEVLIHAFLFGGYVSFPDDEEDCDLPKDSPKRYANKNIWQKLFVLVAGVAGNILLVYILVLLAGGLWKQLPSNEYQIKFDKYAPSALETTLNSGFEKGDIIYSINGQKIIYPASSNKFFTMSKEFDGQASQNIIDKKYDDLIAINPNIDFEEIIPAGTTIKIPEYTDEPAIELSQDNMLGIGKEKLHETPLSDNQKNLRDDINYSNEYTLKNDTYLIDIAAAISDTKKPISVIVLRDGQQVALNTLYSGKDGKLGIQQEFIEKYTPTKTFKQLITGTCSYVNYNTKLMFYVLGKLFTGQISFNNLNGIIAVVKIGSDVINYQGLFKGLLFAAIISLNLAIMNILPIPALDGGHVMFLIIEKITGKEIDKEVLNKINNIFFYLLIALILYVSYNDIFGLITGKF